MDKICLQSGTGILKDYLQFNVRISNFKIFDKQLILSDKLFPNIAVSSTNLKYLGKLLIYKLKTYKLIYFLIYGLSYLLVY